VAALLSKGVLSKWGQIRNRMREKRMGFRPKYQLSNLHFQCNWNVKHVPSFFKLLNIVGVTRRHSPLSKALSMFPALAGNTKRNKKATTQLVSV
jgi:hypothetical protein